MAKYPMPSPRRRGGTTLAAIAPVAVVMMPNHRPLTNRIAYTHPRLSTHAYGNTLSANSSTASASPRLRPAHARIGSANGRTSTWAKTITVMTSPAWVAVPPSFVTTYSGSEAISA